MQMLRKRIAIFLARRVDVETTAEGKSALPVAYKKWAKRLRI